MTVSWLKGPHDMRGNLAVGAVHVRENEPGVRATPLLEIRELTVDFGLIKANDEITFSLYQGEVLGIVGENGAGKSTLVKILAGLQPPTSGEIILEGRSVTFSNPRQAAEAGIGVVHQHFKLVEALTVEENLALSLPALRGGVVRYEPLREHFRSIADQLGVQLPFKAVVSALPVSIQQQVELVKALLRDPRLLILDEPTAVLAPAERLALMKIIGRLRDQGTATILVSHKLEDLFESCDRAVVLRLGHKVGEAPVRQNERESLVRLIVGSQIPATTRSPSRPGKRVLSVSDLTLVRQNGSIAAKEISFDLHAGEILAICGVDGNGQSELFKAIAGIQAPWAGQILFELDTGVVFGPGQTPKDDIPKLAHIAEDRLHDAIVPEFSMADNWMLRRLNDKCYRRGLWLKHSQARQAVWRAIKKYDIRARHPMMRMAELSGGNQQKTVVARELENSPKIVLAGHPTRGLDLRTIAAVRARLIHARDEGAAILLLSADLDEVVVLADRVLVLAGGRQHGPVDTDQITIAEIGAWMTSS